MKAKPQGTPVVTEVTEIPTVRAVILKVSNRWDPDNVFTLAHSGNEVTFGRSQDCTVPFGDDSVYRTVSSRHCTLRADFERKSWTVKDEGSTNGTFFLHGEVWDTSRGVHCGALHYPVSMRTFVRNPLSNSTFAIGYDVYVDVELYEGPITPALSLLLSDTFSLNRKPVNLLQGTPEILITEVSKPQTSDQVKLLTYTPLTADEQEGGETVNTKSSDMDDFNNSEEIAMNHNKSLELLKHMQAQKQMQARYAEMF